MNVFRLYAPDDLGADGYPPEWHRLPRDILESWAGCPADLGGQAVGIKHLVRVEVGNRCVRCLHPYEPRTGEWSPCDAQCVHRGPARYRPGWSDLGEGMGDRGDIDPWADDTCTPPDSRAGQLVSDGIDVEARWRILTVHHLDGNKANCCWWNLAALCQRCHLTIQGKVQMARVWPWEHSDWFKPYVAGYYAFAYLGEETTRDEATERLDELLALERAA